mmetsp:Transcript_18715/g.33970  ORF Transcript_18715/g.33970 Transcript_18715/m.33970 type:complete len:236 (-) Transcript_18715:564-1271(-)
MNRIMKVHNDCKGKYKFINKRIKRNKVRNKYMTSNLSFFSLFHLLSFSPDASSLYSARASSAREATMALAAVSMSSSVMCRWVTNLRYLCPMSEARIPCLFKISIDFSTLNPSFRRTRTIFVSMGYTSSTTSWHPFNTSPSCLALTWSSSRRFTLCSNAYMPAAARKPACLIPPPNAFLNLLALLIKGRLPRRIEPTGQPRPFERQMETESKIRPRIDGSKPAANAALKMRAPSR